MVQFLFQNCIYLCACVCVCVCRASLDRLGAESMEIYQIHWPFGLLDARYWDGLADCVEQGLVKVQTPSHGNPSPACWSTRVGLLRAPQNRYGMGRVQGRGSSRGRPNQTLSYDCCRNSAFIFAFFFVTSCICCLLCFASLCFALLWFCVIASFWGFGNFCFWGKKRRWG